MDYQPTSDVTEQGVPLKCLPDFFSKRQKATPASGRGLDSDEASITWRKKRRDTSEQACC